MTLNPEGLKYLITQLRPYYRNHLATKSHLAMEYIHGMRDLQGCPHGYNYISPFYKYFGIKQYRNLRSKAYWMEDKWTFFTPRTWRFDGAIESADLRHPGYATELNRMYIYNDKTFEYSYRNYADKDVDIALTREFRNGATNPTWKKFEPYVNQDMIVLRTGHGDCNTNKNHHQTVILEIPWNILPSSVHYWRVGIYGGIPYTNTGNTEWRAAKILIHHSKTRLNSLPAGEDLRVTRIGEEYQYEVTGTFNWVTGHPDDDQKYQSHTMKLEKPEGMAYTYVALEIDADTDGYNGTFGLLFNWYIRDDIWESVTRFDDHHKVLLGQSNVPKMYSGMNQYQLKKLCFPSWPHFGDRVTVMNYISDKQVDYSEYICTGPAKTDGNNGFGYWHYHSFIHPHETNADLIKGWTGEHDNQQFNMKLNMMSKMTIR